MHWACARLKGVLVNLLANLGNSKHFSFLFVKNLPMTLLASVRPVQLAFFSPQLFPICKRYCQTNQNQSNQNHQNITNKTKKIEEEKKEKERKKEEEKNNKTKTNQTETKKNENYKYKQKQ
jgi:uncharacterized membrane protein YgaE (UPF0421/DUF939 family)